MQYTKVIRVKRLVAKVIGVKRGSVDTYTKVIRVKRLVANWSRD